MGAGLVAYWFLNQRKEQEELPETTPESQQLPQKTSTAPLIPEPANNWEGPGSRPNYENAETIRKRQQDAEEERRRKIAEDEAREVERKRKQAEAEAEAQRQRQIAEAEAEAQRQRQLAAEAEANERRRIQAEAEAEAQRQRQAVVDAENRRKAQAIAVATAQRNRITNLPVRSYTTVISSIPKVRSLQAGYLAGGELGSRIGRAVYNLMNAQQMDARRANIGYLREAGEQFPIRYRNSYGKYDEVLKLCVYFSNADLDNTYCDFCGLIINFNDFSCPCAGNPSGGHSYEPLVLMLQTTAFSSEMNTMASHGPVHFCTKCDTLSGANGKCAAGGNHTLSSRSLYLNSAPQDILPLYSQHWVRFCGKCEGFFLSDGKACPGGGVHERVGSTDYWVQIIRNDPPADWNRKLIDFTVDTCKSVVALWKWAREQWGWFYGDVRQPHRDEALRFYDSWLREFRKAIFDLRELTFQILKLNPIEYTFTDWPANDNIYVNNTFKSPQGGVLFGLDTIDANLKGIEERRREMENRSADHI